MARDLTQEPILAVDAIQGDILVGLVKKTEHLLFFSISDVGAFKPFIRGLDVTSMKVCLDQQALIKQRKKDGIESLIPTRALTWPSRPRA